MENEGRSAHYTLLIILLLDIPAIIRQTPCWHAVMTSKIPPEAH